MGKIGKTLKNLLYTVAFAAGVYLLPSCHKPEPKPAEAYLDVSPTYGYSPLNVRMKVGGTGQDGADNLRKYRLYIPGKNVIEKNQPIDTIIKIKNYENTDRNYAIGGEVVDNEGNISNKNTKVVTVRPGKINRFVQPNDSTLLYYGSGDVDRNNVVNGDDRTAMNITSNDQSDIDGDGVPSTANDKKLLEDKLDGKIDHLPAYWNELNREERRDWFVKMIKIDKTNEIIPTNEFNCDEHVYQTIMNFNGFREKDLQKFLDASPLYDISKNGRFNIPIDFVDIGFYDVNNQRLGGHATGTVILGDDALNMENRLNFETETDALDVNFGKDYIPSDNQKIFIKGLPVRAGQENGTNYAMLTEHIEYSLKDNVFTLLETNPKLEFVTKREK